MVCILQTTFSKVYVNEYTWNLIEIALKCILNGPIDCCVLPLVQVMAWRRVGDKPLPDPNVTEIHDATHNQIIDLTDLL